MSPIRISITALAPISHSSFGDVSTGNSSTLRREKLCQLDGHPRVPCLSGNSIRGQLRRIVFRDLFRYCGLSREEFVQDGKGSQWERLYAALANGGHQDKGRSEVRADPDYRRALRVALPPLSAFGAALYTWLLEGRIKGPGFAWPVCDETIAAGLGTGDSPGPAEDLVTEVGLVRHVDREEHDPALSGVTPMPTSVEAFAVGVRLESVLTVARNATDLEAAVFAWGLDRLRTAGGKLSGGLGVIDLEHTGDAAPYQEWLTENTEATAARLRKLAEELDRKPVKPKRSKDTAA